MSSWIRQENRGDPRSASSSVGPQRAPIPARPAARRHRQRSQHHAKRLCRMRLDVPRRRPGGDEAGRRNRIRQRDIGDERERTGRQEADVRLGEGVARVLEAEITAGDGRFRGIRHSVVWDPSETFSRGRTNSPKGQMADPTWRTGFARLAPLNLTFEAWLYHPQLIELADLARAFPQTTIILNHVGGPLGIGPYADKKEETFAAWKAGIAELGKCQNVVVKLGGLGMLFGMFDFHTRETPPSSEDLASAYKPYIDTCITAFGVDRGMFESNYPPDGASSSYPILWNAFKRLAADFSADEKAKLFSGTAKRVYRLT